MSTAKPSRPARTRLPPGVYTADPDFTFTADDQVALVEAAQFQTRYARERRETLLREFRRILSTYPAIERYADHVPRSARRRAALRRVGATARTLRTLLVRDDVRSALAHHGVHLAREAEGWTFLDRLIEAQVGSERARGTTRTGRSRPALRRIIGRLSCVYDRLEPFAATRAHQRAKTALLLTALEAADIRHPEETGRFPKLVPPRCPPCTEAGRHDSPESLSAFAWTGHAADPEDPRVEMSELVQKLCTETGLEFHTALEQVKRENPQLTERVGQMYGGGTNDGGSPGRGAARPASS